MYFFLLFFLSFFFLFFSFFTGNPSFSLLVSLQSIAGRILSIDFIFHLKYLLVVKRATFLCSLSVTLHKRHSNERSKPFAKPCAALLLTIVAGQKWAWCLKGGRSLVLSRSICMYMCFKKQIGRKELIVEKIIIITGRDFSVVVSYASLFFFPGIFFFSLDVDRLQIP